MRVLLVDDHEMLRDALSLHLRASGHEVAQAANGEAALAVIERCAPDVLITDLDMPVMDGAELISRVRRTYPALPIVAMTGGNGTALAALKDVDRACKLEKPFTARQLRGAIAHACDAA